MRCFFTFTIAAALAVGLTATSWSQTGGAGGAGAGTGAAGASATGGAGTTGTSNTAGTSGSATAGTTGTAGTGGKVGTAGNVGTGAPAGNVGAPGSSTDPGAPNGVPLPTGGTANGRPSRPSGPAGSNNANVNGRAAIQSNINRTPFFTDPGVRRQLNLNDTQFNTLNQAHQNAFARFNQGLTNLNNPNLTEQQRALQLQQLEAQFNQNFGTSLNSTLNDPQTLNRFNQLNRQFQGANAFNDPAVRKQLNLSQDQIRQLRTLQMNWRQQLQQFRTSGANRTAADPAQWAQLQQQFATQLNGVLTPEQQKMWSQQTGQPFMFSPNTFFGPAVQPNGNGNQPLTPAQTGVVPNGPASQDQTTNVPTTVPTGSGAITPQGTTAPASTTPASTAQGTQGGTVR